MTHERYQDLVSDYLDRSLSPGDLRDFETHLAGCAECSRLTERVRQALRDLQDRQDIRRCKGSFGSSWK